MAALVEATLAAETVSVDMSTLATEDIDRFRTIFDAVGLYFFLVTSSTQNALLSSTDVDHSGTITNDELQGLFKILEMEVTDEEIDRLVRIVDVDRSGTLSFHEFVTMVCVMAANEEKEKEEHRSNLRVVFDSVGESTASPFSLTPLPRQTLIRAALSPPRNLERCSRLSVMRPPWRRSLSSSPSSMLMAMVR
jgi:hypothetical protein